MFLLSVRIEVWTPPAARERRGGGRKGGEGGGQQGEERIEGAWWNSHIILQQLIAIHRASAIFSSFLSNSTDPPWNG